MDLTVFPRGRMEPIRENDTYIDREQTDSRQRADREPEREIEKAEEKQLPFKI
jgi:hypothetical protein